MSKPSEKLLVSAKLIPNLRRQKGFLFTYRGHEVDLSSSGESVVQILGCIADQLAKKLTDIYLNGVEELLKCESLRY